MPTLRVRYVKGHKSAASADRNSPVASNDQNARSETLGSAYQSAHTNPNLRRLSPTHVIATPNNNNNNNNNNNKDTTDIDEGHDDGASKNRSSAILAQAGTNLFRNRQGWMGKTMPFILQEILNTKEHQKYISWAPDGKSWVIHDMDGFAIEVCPLYFRHANYRSFLQNVRNWGFHHEMKEDGLAIFSHPFFLRDDPKKCRELKRVKGKRAQTTSTPSETEVNINTPHSVEIDYRPLVRRKPGATLIIPMDAAAQMKYSYGGSTGKKTDFSQNSHLRNNFNHNAFWRNQQDYVYPDEGKFFNKPLSNPPMYHHPGYQYSNLNQARSVHSQMQQQLPERDQVTSSVHNMIRSMHEDQQKLMTGIQERLGSEDVDYAIARTLQDMKDGAHIS